MDGLVELMLRLFRSLVIDPGQPARQGKDVRDFLRRSVAPAISGLVPVRTYAGWSGTPGNKGPVGPAVTQPPNFVMRCGAKTAP